MSWLRRRLLRISPAEADFGRRGFRTVDPEVKARLEQVGRRFLAGYNTAIQEGYTPRLVLKLAKVERADRGFAYEGAAMALAVLDFLSPWRSSRLAAFAQTEGSPHLYMIHIGAGWALARLPIRVEKFLNQLDPVLGWLAVDGYGFHEGYFHPQRRIYEMRVPRRLRGYARRAFDQGLGRSLWFVEGAGVDAAVDRVSSFPEHRRAHLWSGIGLAAAYAGGVSAEELEKLREAADGYHPDLAQGAAFAAKARWRAGNPVPHTDTACRLLCGRTASEAALTTESAMAGLRADEDSPAYEIWRQRIQQALRSREVPP